MVQNHPRWGPKQKQSNMHFGGCECAFGMFVTGKANTTISYNAIYSILNLNQTNCTTSLFWLSDDTLDCFSNLWIGVILLLSEYSLSSLGELMKDNTFWRKTSSCTHICWLYQTRVTHYQVLEAASFAELIEWNILINNVLNTVITVRSCYIHNKRL